MTKLALADNYVLTGFQTCSRSNNRPFSVKTDLTGSFYFILALSRSRGAFCRILAPNLSCSNITSYRVTKLAFDWIIFHSPGFIILTHNSFVVYGGSGKIA